MICKIIIICITILAIPTGAFAGETSTQAHPSERRMTAFGKKIDFDKAVLNHVTSEKIVFDWKRAGIPGHLKGWKVIDEDYTEFEGRRPRQIWTWGYTNGSHDIGVEVTLHKGDGPKALLEIRNLADRSSAAETPYNKGPADLGTLSAERPNGLVYYWAYRDLSFKVESTSHEMALKTAHWLDSIAEAHRKPRQ